MTENRIKRQLAPLGKDRARILGGLIEGVKNLLTSDSVFSTLSTREVYAVFAATYAIAKRSSTEYIERVGDRNPGAVDEARQALEEMDQIVLLLNAPDPAPEKEPTSLADALMAAMGSRIVAAEANTEGEPLAEAEEDLNDIVEEIGR